MGPARAFWRSLAGSGQPARPTGPSLWCDASNYSRALTDQGCADLKAAGVVGVIIQAITGNDGISYTTQQLAACKRNGLRIQGYCWAFPAVSKSSIVSRLYLFNGYDLEHLWLDVEQVGLKIADVDRDLAACDAYMGGKLTGIYSGRWFWQRQGWLAVTKWADQGRALWDSNYDQVPVVEANFRPYGGWMKPAIKQYRGTSSIGHVSQIDLDVAAA